MHISFLQDRYQYNIPFLGAVIKTGNLYPDSSYECIKHTENLEEGCGFLCAAWKGEHKVLPCIAFWKCNELENVHLSY